MPAEKLNNEGYNMLSRALQQRMQQVGERPPLLEFGLIQGDMSLLVNKFPIPFPQTDYFVCRQLTIGETDDVLTRSQATQDNIVIPEKMRWIKPGDHVLVAWVDSDPVVIDIILPATEVG